MTGLAQFPVVLAAGATVVLAALAWLEAPGGRLKGGASPHGITSLALANPRRSAAILQSWRRGFPPGAWQALRPSGEGHDPQRSGDGDDPRLLDAAQSALRRDYALVAAAAGYVTALAWSGAGVTGWHWPALAGLAVVAACLGVAENVLLWRRVEAARAQPMEQQATWAVHLTRAATWGKFGALGLAAAVLVAVPGLLPILALLLAGRTVGAVRYQRRHARERAETLAREREQLEQRHGPVPTGPPAGVDDDRWRPACDVVLKGGVTSGVIYPPALLRLARDFRFRSIGGTSAGAVAAGCAAAAEHGRQHHAAAPAAGAGSGGGFAGLAEVYRALGEPVSGYPTLLRSLFQAERRTRPLLQLFEAAGGQRTGLHRAARVARAALSAFWWRALLLALAAAAAVLVVAWALEAPVENLAQRFAEPGGVARYLTGHWLEAVAGGGAAPVQRAAAVALAVALAAAAALAAATLTGLLRIVRVEVPENSYGICSGRTVAGADTPALTDWLAETIDTLAFGGEMAAPAPDSGTGAASGASGHPRAPLTFGMLWGTDDVPPGDLRVVEGRPPPGADIVLELVTTCLTEARPLRLPYDLDREDFWFAPSELAQLLPGEVVRYLVRQGTARLHEHAHRHAPGSGEELVPLPRRADLPVVLAVRMSLSLPLVLSAVPLWHCHGGTVERCWFSDGGLTSNFPVHLFDTPVPRRPTFGFGLRRWSPGVRDPLVELPASFDEGADPYRLRIGERDLGGFVSALADSARSWVDETLARKPGYRERIAHVYHSSSEGGMNLDMDTATIRALGDRGHAAADLLAGRYLPGAVASEDAPVSWNSHRWARASITLAAVGEYLADLRAGWDDSSELAGQPTYGQLASQGTGEGYPPQPFPLTLGQRALLRASVGGLRAVALPLRRLEHGDGRPGTGRGVRRWGITLLRPSTRR